MRMLSLDDSRFAWRGICYPDTLTRREFSQPAARDTRTGDALSKKPHLFVRALPPSDVDHPQDAQALRHGADDMAPGVGQIDALCNCSAARPIIECNVTFAIGGVGILRLRDRIGTFSSSETINEDLNATHVVVDSTTIVVTCRILNRPSSRTSSELSILMKQGQPSHSVWTLYGCSDEVAKRDLYMVDGATPIPHLGSTRYRVMGATRLVASRGA